MTGKVIEALVWVWKIVETVFTCSHGRVTLSEGKCICPDCGQGVIARWVVLRCTRCNSRRSGRYLFKSVMPAENFCTRCGERETVIESLENPPYYMVMNKAILLIENEDDYWESLKPSWFEQTKAWFDPAENRTCRGLLAAAS
jgi:uncharacterized protein (DUF983 family)